MAAQTTLRMTANCDRKMKSLLCGAGVAGCQKGALLKSLAVRVKSCRKLYTTSPVPGYLPLNKLKSRETL